MRIENDSMGEMKVPSNALYGASTQRAVLNFPISGNPMPPCFIHGLGLVKWAAAKANEKLGAIDSDKAALIQRAAWEIFEGKLDQQFPVDVFQTGSGTSTNTNANEVIANRAAQLAGLEVGTRNFVHPNDHVNFGQSSNDIIPSALHVSVVIALRRKLIPALRQMEVALTCKSREFRKIVKIGRTHLMDATPLTLGQEFSGYAAQAQKSLRRAERAVDCLLELAVGGTAVGTGINCNPRFPGLVCTYLREHTGVDFREADNHFEAQAARDDAVEVAGLLATISVSLTKIANDIRLLSSGPRAGLGELTLPATQPGSSIMPGKVNPVMSEMMVQVCLYTQGLCQTVVNCGRDGHLELNVTIPLIAKCLHESIHLLSNAVNTFNTRCIDGLQANAERCDELVKQSLMLVTALNPHIGYDQSAKVAKIAFSENKSLRQVVLELGLMSESDLDEALDPTKMVG